MSDKKDINIVNRKINVDTNSDVFKLFVALALISMAINIAAGRIALQKSNELRQQALDVAKKQYTLDSLRYYAPQKHR